MSGLLNRFFGSYQEGGSPAEQQGPDGYGGNNEVGSPVGGRRRRHRSLKRPKRRSRANKRSRKHYGGKSQEEQEEEQEQEEQEQEEQEQEQEQEQEEEESTRGGKRRRKGRRGKKTRGKTSSWIKHVLKFAKDNKMKYSQALKDKRCRSTYKSHKK
jgi:hypothetical protein